MKTTSELLDKILENNISLERIGTMPGQRGGDRAWEWANTNFGAKIVHCPEKGFQAWRYLYVYESFDEEGSLFPMKEEDGLLVTNDGTVIYLYEIKE